MQSQYKLCKSDFYTLAASRIITMNDIKIAKLYHMGSAFDFQHMLGLSRVYKCVWHIRAANMPKHNTTVRKTEERKLLSMKIRLGSLCICLLTSTEVACNRMIYQQNDIFPP